jgi:acetyltransferase-like isoleucine patch superfamily enzyme
MDDAHRGGSSGSSLPWQGLRTRWRAQRTQLRRLERGGRAVVGSNTYGDPRVLIFDHDATRLIIGAYTSIATDCLILLGGEHRIDTVSTFPLRIRLALAGAGTDGQPSSKGDVRIGSDVWIGARSTILSGSTIGDGAVIGAGSLVSGDVPPYSIAVGAPARPIRFRFDERSVECLLRIRWWEWPEEMVRECADDLSSANLTSFITRYDPGFPSLESHGPAPTPTQ